MEKHSLYFIYKGRLLPYLGTKFREDVEKYPTFEDFKTHTTVFGGQYWVVNTFSLTNLPLHISKEPIDEVRKKQGIQGFGEGPTLKDGNGRVVFSIARLDQFYTNPIPESRTPDFDKLWALRCLQIKDERIPVTFPISIILLDDPLEVFFDLVLLFEEIDSTTHVGLEARYKKPKLFDSITPGNIVYPGSSLSDFIQLQLVLKDAEFSEGSLDCLTVILEEHTTCPVLFDGEIRMLKDVRSLKLCQHSINIDYTLRLFLNVENSFIFPLQICGETLPNLGPSFYSNNCARSYSLKFILNVKDSLNNLKVSALLKIDVALVDYKAHVGNIAQLRKERDLIYLDPWENTLLEAREMSLSLLARGISFHVWNKIEDLQLRFYGFQTIAAKRGNHVLAITVFNLPHAEIEDRSSLWFGQYRRKETIDQKSDFLLVPTGTCWEFREKHIAMDDALQIAVSDSLAVFKSVYDTSSIDEFYNLKLLATYLRGKYVFPGMPFESIVSLKAYPISGLRPNVAYISIHLIEQTVGLTKSGLISEKRKIQLAHKHKVKFTFDRGFCIPERYSGICKIPDVAPTVYSSTFQRGYSIYIEVEMVKWKSSRQLEVVICDPKVRPSLQ